MGAMTKPRRKKKPLPVTVADPGAPLSLRDAAKLAQVSTATIRDRRPALIEAGARQINPTRWEVTPRQMETVGLIRIRPAKPEADPLEAAQAAREAARAAERAEVRQASPTREESAGTPPPSAREAERWQEKRRAEAAADPYAARVALDAEHSRLGAEASDVIGAALGENAPKNPGFPGGSSAGLDARDALDARVRAVAEPSRVAALELELAEARHALELAEHARKLAEAQAAARAWEDRAKTFELLAAERGQTIAMLTAMLGGSAPVTRALDA